MKEGDTRPCSVTRLIRSWLHCRLQAMMLRWASRARVMTGNPMQSRPSRFWNKHVKAGG